jgi:UDP-glucose 4-epimerase
VLATAAGTRPCVTVYGDDYPTPDGTCVRDYVHVVDLARAHILALSVVEERSGVYNLGCGGAGYSVRQVVEVARAVTGKEVPIHVGARRSGDPAVLIAASDRIQRDLGWSPKYQDLKAIIGSAWSWHQTHPRGYSS